MEIAALAQSGVDSEELRHAIGAKLSVAGVGADRQVLRSNVSLSDNTLPLVAQLARGDRDSNASNASVEEEVRLRVATVRPLPNTLPTGLTSNRRAAQQQVPPPTPQLGPDVPLFCPAAPLRPLPLSPPLGRRAGLWV